MKATTRKIRIAFHGEEYYARDSILRFIFQGSDKFELCAEGDSRCDAIVFDYRRTSLVCHQPTEWDRLVREIGSIDRKPVVILDCSDEAWQPPRAFREKVAETLQDTNPKIRRVVFLTQNRLFFQNDEVHRNHGAELEYVYFHGYLARIAAELRGVMEKDGGACLENMFANRVEARKSPSPRFVCLMKRPRRHRLVVMGHLIRTGALKHGNVSFLSFLPRGRGSLERIINATRGAFPRFSDEIDALAGFSEAKHGFRNFEDDADNHLSIGIGGNASRDTQVELVVEAEMTDGHALMAAGREMREVNDGEAGEFFRRFTEKSLKAPLLWHAFLVCGNLSTLPLLEEIGIGETGFGGDYDSVRDPQERLKAVLDKFDDYLSGSLKPDEGYLWRNRDIHARFLDKAEESAAKSMDTLSRILLDEQRVAAMWSRDNSPGNLKATTRKIKTAFHSILHSTVQRKATTRKIRIAFHGQEYFARDSILHFIVQRLDRFELCADGDSCCDAIVVNIHETRLVCNQLTEWDRLVREIGSTDRKPVVILDCSHEAWQPPRAFREKVAETLADTNRKIRRVVFLTQNRLHFRDGEVHRNHGAGLEYVYFHGWLSRIVADLRAAIKEDGGACLESMFADRVEAWKSPSPRFVCLMKKPWPHRLVVMGHLIRTGALKHGNVSFLSYIPPRFKAGWTLKSEIARARIRFPRFKDEINALADFPEVKNPNFLNFKDDVKQDNDSRARDIGIGRNARKDTQVELVVETEMTDGHALITDGREMTEVNDDESGKFVRRFTEKSLKAPLVWNAFLVCGNRSTLPLLGEVGISETGFGGDYDSVKNPPMRLKAVFDTFDNYLSGSLKLDEGYLHRNRDIHARFLDKAEENIAKSMDALSQILLDEL